MEEPATVCCKRGAYVDAGEGGFRVPSLSTMCMTTMWIEINYYIRHRTRVACSRAHRSKKLIPSCTCSRAARWRRWRRRRLEEEAQQATFLHAIKIVDGELKCFTKVSRRLSVTSLGKATSFVPGNSWPSRQFGKQGK